MKLSAAVLLVPSLALANPPSVQLQLETGAEIDTNVHRTSPDAQAAPDARAAGRVTLAWHPAHRQALSLAAVGGAKEFAGPSSITTEDVWVVSLDGRYDAGIGDKPLALGARASFYDAGAAALDEDFWTADGTAALTLLADGDHHLAATAGYRAFTLRQNPAFDFGGEHAGLAWTHTFQRAPKNDDDNPPTWDLAVAYTIARRGYTGHALEDVCAPDQPLVTSCLVTTASRRSDLFHDASVDLTYTGGRIFDARYTLQVDDSNSFGYSLIRHRIDLSATTELFADIYLNAKLTLQLNQFVDSQLYLLTGDLGTYLTIEDETRNALAVHLSRAFGKHWLVEARWAFYANAFATHELAYRRQTFYLGAVYRFRS